MNSNQNTVIVLLMISAGVLTGLLVGGFVGTQGPAEADTSTRSPNVAISVPPNAYSICTGGWDTNIDILYVMDINAEKLNAYVTNTKTEAIEQFDTISLPQAFGKIRR